MIITPKFPNDVPGAGVQNDPASLSGSPLRRGFGSDSSAPISNAAELAVRQPSELTDMAAASATDSGPEIADGNAADSLMTSLRAGILGQSGAAVLAHADLSPQTVYDLLQ